MGCSFVPPRVYERIANDESLSEETRQDARAQLNAINNTSNPATNPTTIPDTIRIVQAPVSIREGDAVSIAPPGLGFSAKIWGMAGKNYDEVNYQTGEVYGTSYSPLPGIPYATSQDPPYTQDPDVIACIEALRTTYNFYDTVFNRKSVDDGNLQLEASIHYGLRYPNAHWNLDAKQMIFGDGDGASRFDRPFGLFKPGSFVNSLDVTAHEVTHGVTQYTHNLVYEGETGALNESISDVFASMVVQWSKSQDVNQASWLIGENMIYEGSEQLAESQKGAKHMRSLKDPSAPTNLNPQPDKMSHELFYHPTGQSDDKDHGGVHQNSGVPNHAFYRLAMALGGKSWERAGKIWYGVLSGDRLTAISIFSDFATLTIDKARELYPDEAWVTQAVEQAWKDVEVVPRPVPRQ